MTDDLADVAARFHNDGFALVRGFLDRNEIDELDREVNRYIHNVLPNVPRTHKVYESGWSGALKHFSRLELYDDYFKRFFDRTSTVELAETCLGTPVEPVTSELFYKPAHVGGAALYHQDNAYFNYLSPYGLVVWIAMDDVTLENGAVHFARGSHRLGDLPHDETGVALFTKALGPTLDPEQHPEVPAILERGDASVHHFLTAHRSGPNRTDKNRRGFVLDYKAQNAKINEQIQKEHEAYKARVFTQSGAL